MPKVSFTSSGDRPIDGSSISMSFGSSSRPRAISSSFCSPPDSVEACAPALRRSMGKRSISDSMRPATFASRPAAVAPSSRLCSTLSSGNTLRPCGT